MTQEVHTSNSVETIREMAQEMRDTADRMDNLAKRMEKGDWIAVSDAIATAANLMPSLRLDTLAARAVREHQLHIARLESSTTTPKTSEGE